MAAYIVAQVEVRNTNWQAEYGPKTGALVQKYGGRVLAGAGSAMEHLEGEGKLPTVLVILEFPSLEQAKAWDNDPEYAPMIKLRQTGAETNMVVVDGL